MAQYDRTRTQLRAAPGLLEVSDGDLARLLRDPEQAEAARVALVSRYEPLVRAAAYRYQLPAQHYEDLIQVGFIGLMKAINSFDPAIRPDLKPYAHVCVSGEIKRYFRDKRWLLRVSRTDQEVLLDARKAAAELAADPGATPADEQVAARLNVSIDVLRHAYQAHSAFTPESLDSPVSADDDRDTADLVGADEPLISQITDMDTLRQHWTELPRIQRKILLMRFYGNMTQAQIADRLHCSQMHVSRLQARALAFLRARLLAE